MVDIAFDSEFAASVRTERRRYMLGRVGVYAFLMFLRGDLSAAAVRHCRQFVPRPAGDHAERAHRVPAQLFAESLAERLGAFLRRRHLRGRTAQFLQFVVDDDSGDDHFDIARRDQRLCAVEMAVSRLRIPVWLHDARRVHARSDRADALGLHSRHVCICRIPSTASFSSIAFRACRSRRCSAATTTSAFPTISSRRRASTALDSGASSTRSCCRYRRRSSSSP